MPLEADFHHHVMEHLIPLIHRELARLSQIVQHSVRDYSQQALRLALVPPHVPAQQNSAPVMVRGFIYGYVQGNALIGFPSRQSVAKSLSHALAVLEEQFYRQFWQEHHMLTRRYVTARERTILTLFYLKWHLRDIAEHLQIEKRTIETHCANLYPKLDVHDRTAAIFAGKELGLFLHLS